jgi:predicted glycogen debranching enzyme
VSLLAEVQFGRELCGELEAGEAREWLVTNGLGGFASGTVAGTATRRYHGLLIAALKPPTGRTLLVSGLDESVSYLGGRYSLATNRWLSGFVSPSGYLQIENFFLEGTKPVWQYALTDGLLEKRVWMKQGENTTYVQYLLVRASGPVELDAKVLVGYRDFHGTTRADSFQMRSEPVEKGLRLTAFDGATPFYLKSAGARVEARQEWYHDFFLSAERERGLDDHEDRLYAAEFHARLGLGESVTLVFTTESGTSLDGEEARSEQSNHDLKLFQAWQAKHAETCGTPAEDEPGWLWQLVLAADQFVVKRALPKDGEGQSVIAGYPWFSDWGRDTMIALPGLTLSQGRPEVARRILHSFAQYVEAGMLPNHFPDGGGAPEYNTVDAGLWYFEAARQYFQATHDLGLLSELYPVLAGMVDAHVRGTRYNIKVDPGDALLYAGAPGVGNDSSLRPNQIFAVSLPFSPLGERQQRSVVDAVAQNLLTSHGLRSLAASEPGYKGKYGGGTRERDSAYHQGTVWGWLLGPFALAHFRVYGDREAAQSFLEPLGLTIHAGGLGTIGEIFGGDAPFPAAGCFAQAWSVAEVFRAWELLNASKGERRE